ncbi:MAG: putative lipid II flippase FtsW [Spirochaetaceae bacterium]|jgi:cell division protein FtsW|nr:putative lipid II flippase FtsW [Spirochaetaceae bacterium]
MFREAPQVREIIRVDSPVDAPGKNDFGFAVTIMLMWGLGILTLWTSSSGYGMRLFQNQNYFVIRQLFYSVAALACLLFFANVRMDVLRSILPFLVVGSIVLCLFVFVPGIGIEKNGSRRWLRIPHVMTFQPSETAKIAVVLFIANLLAKRRGDEEKDIRISTPAIGLAVMVLIIFLQKDFSSGVFVLMMGISIFFVAGMKIGWFLAYSFLAFLGSLLFVFLEPYRVNRLIAFMMPKFDLYGLNYQSNVARLAIGAGELFGEGIGGGLTYINRIPEVQADYIFVGWVEAMGFVGVLAYFALLLFFAWRGYTVAVKCPSRFGALTAFGCTTSIFLQTLINTGVVCSALPSTGIPLPFFSAGGSSLLITFAMCGLILNVSRITEDDDGGEV